MSTATTPGSGRQGRRILWVVVGTFYLLPSLLGSLLQWAHGAEHALTSTAELVGASSPASSGGASVVHSHDGSTHAHGPAVAALAAAFTELGPGEEDAPEVVPPLILMAIAAPGRTPEAPAASFGLSSPGAGAVGPWEPVAPRPPPPRG